jgi:ADP-ribose pyrophosphatase YjhB (NUDIX family)
MENKIPEQKLEKDSCCSYCGTKLYDLEYPKRCSNCKEYAWGNPIPVVVALLPVEQDGRRGILIQQRNIDPGKGEWALTGGYINHGENWRQAITRETKEELELETDSNKFQLYDVVSGKSGATILIICYYNIVTQYETLSSFKPNKEVQAVDVAWEPRELAFPSHTQAVLSVLKMHKEYLED